MEGDKVYVALLHYPMYNKRMEIVATSITNLDLHDIARACRTFKVKRFFVVHPAGEQQQLIQDILGYWQEGFGAQYNPDRREAMSTISLCHDLQEVLMRIGQETVQEVKTVATDARTYPNTVSYRGLRAEINRRDRTWLLLFGTGWGMSRELMAMCDYILEPIGVDSDYNHLSVRSAVSIILDRLLGEPWFKD
jgi:hypothetical protein